MNSIGERIRFERERLGLSQTTMGEIGGVKKLAQINYENNSRSPDANYLSALSIAGADVFYIITGHKNENNATTSSELEFLKCCRAFKNDNERKIALKALIAMSECD